jgi:ubiquinol-cytochrome c reductase iron-sulfur subunit
MNEQEKVDKTRRNLVVATSVVGGAAGVGAAVPFAASLWPSERARAAGAPVEVDVSRIPPGELAVIEWRGKPVWVLRRTKEMIESLKAVEPRLYDPQS